MMISYELFEKTDDEENDARFFWEISKFPRQQKTKSFPEEKQNKNIIS